MEKLLKILHRKLDKKLNGDYFKKQNKEMEALFSFDKLPYVNKKEFDFYINEINYHGIINKHEIEKAYKKAKINMDDYYDSLNYEQKYKLMDYEIKKCLEDKIHFSYEGKNIYIPFFDEKLNDIYENEMTLFDIKKYAEIMLYYDTLMKNYRYGYKVFDSDFSSLLYVMEHDMDCSVYCNKRGRLYFLKNYQMIDFISIPCISKDKMEVLSQMYFEQNAYGLIDAMFEMQCIDEKLYKKLTKKRK